MSNGVLVILMAVCLFAWWLTRSIVKGWIAQSLLNAIAYKNDNEPMSITVLLWIGSLSGLAAGIFFVWIIVNVVGGV